MFALPQAVINRSKWSFISVPFSTDSLQCRSIIKICHFYLLFSKMGHLSVYNLCMSSETSKQCPFLICIWILSTMFHPPVNNAAGAIQFCMQLEKCSLHNNAGTVHQIFIALCILCIYCVIISKHILSWAHILSYRRGSFFMS